MDQYNRLLDVFENESEREKTIHLERDDAHSNNQYLSPSTIEQLENLKKSKAQN
jgi:hypothetical protein